MPNTATAQLVAHAGAHRVTRQQLVGIAPPLSTATHRPIAHAELVDTMEDRLLRAGYSIAREQYAVQREGLMLFGTFDLVLNGVGRAPVDGTGLALGFRHGNDKSMALRCVSGARVFVCDNLALVGDKRLFSLVHKHGVMGHLRQSLDQYFGAFDQQIEMLRDRFGVWQRSPLQDIEAKALVYDAVITGVIPSRLLDDINTAYFAAEALGYEDCAPRTKWGLSNAFTRSFKSLNPAPAWTAQRGLTELLG
jgi:hypothetical protein